MVRYPKRDRNPIVSIWGLVTQSYLRFPPALIPVGIAFVLGFGWGMVAGKLVSYKPPTKFDLIVNEAAERAKEIIKQQETEAASQSGFAVERLRHGN